MLVVGHPGHELRVHGWLSAAKPLVCILTDGSGHGPRARLESSAQVLAAVGARRGPIFGRFSDRGLYGALYRRDTAVFIALADELCALILRERPVIIVGDAAEGFNPAHDICRFVVDAAVATAARAGHVAANLEFVLDAAPADLPADVAAGATCVVLNDQALERKLGAARDYVELRGEVDQALARFGSEAFRHEWLRPSTAARVAAACDEVTPFFERHGRAQVAAGIYAEPLTWREHLRPVHDALRDVAERDAVRACGSY
jgi:hypothetical protein